MYEFIKKTIKIVDHDHECGNIDINLGDDCTFNQPITDDKIKKAIKKLNKRPMGHIAHLRKQFKSLYHNVGFRSRDNGGLTEKLKLR